MLHFMTRPGAINIKVTTGDQQSGKVLLYISISNTTNYINLHSPAIIVPINA